MIAAAPLLQQYADDYQRRRTTLPGRHVPWLRDGRDAAMARAVDFGLPTRKNEVWKYTSLQPLVDTSFTLADEPTTVRLDQISQYVLEDAHRLAFVDGSFAPHLSNLGDLPAGVQITSLAQLLDTDPETAKTWLGRQSSNGEHVGIALNAALLQDGVFMRIARDTVLERPLQLLFLGAGAGMNSALRNIIVLEPGSRATVIESYFSLTDAAHFTNTLSEVYASPNASVELTTLAQENGSALHLGALFCTLEQGASLQHNNFALGGALVRRDLHITLNGPMANLALNGLHMTREKQHVDNQVFVDHRAAHCSSRQLYKGVLADRSRTAFGGRVVVQPGAQKTDAKQANHNLLLSKDTDANSKPQLEIYADDVKCAHGATVGRLDDQALFYLQSRGIGMEEARVALVQAFAQEVVNNVAHASIRAWIGREVEHQRVL